MARRSKTPQIAEDIPPPELDKYPPRLTSKILGQDRAVRSFLDAARGARFAHAWLLVGPLGVGKASFAWAATAAFLHTSDRHTIEDLDIPPDCPTARYIRQGAHQDLAVITRQYNHKLNKFNKNILSESAYGLRDFFRLKSASGGWRVAILDNLNEMDFRATNALLKILEEPPPRSLLFLVAHHSGRVLDTIRSRCRCLTFDPLTPEVIIQILAQHFPDLSPADARQCAMLADGSAARALDFAEGEGLGICADMVTLLEQLPTPNTAQLDNFASRFDAHHAPDAFSVFVQIFNHWLTRLILTMATKQPMEALIAREDKLALHLSRTTRLENWIELWEKIAHMERETIRLNLDRKQTVFEWFAMAGRIAMGERP